MSDAPAVAFAARELTPGDRRRPRGVGLDAREVSVEVATGDVEDALPGRVVLDRRASRAVTGSGEVEVVERPLQLVVPGPDEREAVCRRLRIGDGGHPLPVATERQTACVVCRESPIDRISACREINRPARCVRLRCRDRSVDRRRSGRRRADVVCRVSTISDDVEPVRRVPALDRVRRPPCSRRWRSSST